MMATMKFKGWPLLLALGLVFVLQLTVPAQIWTMLFIGLGLLGLIAYIWARGLQHGILLVRERRYTMAQVGDRLEERFTIYRSGYLPALWLELTDHSTLPGYQASQVTGLGAHSHTRWRSESICTRRGIYQLGPTELDLGDPFGLFAIHQHYPNRVEFTVAPPIVALPDIQVASRGHAGEGAPRPYSLAPTEPTTTVRPHTPADSLNRIHWPTSARRESLYVRGLQEPTSGDWWLVLDMDQAVHSGQDIDSTLEKGVLIAASLADRGLTEAQAVGLLAQGREAVWLPPQSTPLQRWRILTALARIEAGQLNLADLLTRSNRLIKQNTSLIVITASTDSDWLNPLLLLKRQGVVPTTVLVYTEQTRPALEAIYHTLLLQGIRAYLIDQASLSHPTYEDLAGRWEWRTLGTGRAVAVHRPEGEWEAV